MAAWDLSVTVEDLGSDAPPVTISVASDLHVGGVIVKLVEKTRGSSYLYSAVFLSQSYVLTAETYRYLQGFANVFMPFELFNILPNILMDFILIYLIFYVIVQNKNNFIQI
ncbi:hypothetical protein AMECASPLE_010988 [Ameca splendens]|uniref:Kindlin-2 N-terminal domain-containing protein n=1 Tax=Ameca splendens TaxID=208324 RepID=A0ABV0Z9H9_9TELE